MTTPQHLEHSVCWGKSHPPMSSCHWGTFWIPKWLLPFVLNSSSPESSDSDFSKVDMKEGLRRSPKCSFHCSTVPSVLGLQLPTQTKWVLEQGPLSFWDAECFTKIFSRPTKSLSSWPPQIHSLLEFLHLQASKLQSLATLYFSSALGVLRDTKVPKVSSISLTAPPARPLVAASTGTNDLEATASRSCICNRGCKHYPFRFHVPTFPRTHEKPSRRCELKITHAWTWCSLWTTHA